MHLATIRCNCAPAAALDVDYYVANFRLTPPPQIFNFFPNFKCLWGPPRLVRSSSPSGYILPRSPQKRTGLGFLFFSKCLLRNTLHRYLVLAILLRVNQRLVLVPQVEGIPIILGFFWRTSSELPSMLS